MYNNYETMKVLMQLFTQKYLLIQTLTCLTLGVKLGVYMDHFGDWNSIIFYHGCMM